MGCEVLAISFSSFWWVFEIVVAALIVLAAYLWVTQFAQLMALGDGDFAGRYDKTLWVAAFVFTFILGALAFVVWKKVMVEVRSSRR